MKCILVVDDNPVARELLREVLEAPGREIVEASHGQEALEKMRQMGIKVVKPNAQGEQEMINVAYSIRPKLVGKLYSAQLLREVEGYLAQYRSRRKARRR